MELSFAPKEQSGWRGRGAPRKQVPQKVLDMLRHTDTGEVGIIDTRNDSAAEIREVMALLRAGARHMARNLRLQRDEDNHQIRFELAPRRAS